MEAISLLNGFKFFVNKDYRIHLSSLDSTFDNRIKRFIPEVWVLIKGVWCRVEEEILQHPDFAGYSKGDGGGNWGCKKVFLVDARGNSFAKEGTLVGIDPTYDLAVLRVDVEWNDLKPTLLGTSCDQLVGQSCFAIGNPYGYENTLTTEIPHFGEEGYKGDGEDDDLKCACAMYDNDDVPRNKSIIDKFPWRTTPLSNSNTVGIVSSFIATTTFSAYCYPPGGVFQDSGEPILGGTALYKVFSGSNKAALATSVGILASIPFWCEPYVTHKVMCASLTFMAIAYIAGTWVAVTQGQC